MLTINIAPMIYIPSHNSLNCSVSAFNGVRIFAEMIRIAPTRGAEFILLFYRRRRNGDKQAMALK